MLKTCEIIPFRVVQASSEEKDFPATNLEANRNAGWRALPNASPVHHMIIQPLPEGLEGLTLSSIQVIFKEAFAIRNVEILIANTDETCNDVEVDSLHFDSICNVAFDQNETCSHGVQIINSICLGEGDLDASFLKLIIEPFDQGPSDQIGIVSLTLLTKSKSYNSHSSVDIATPLASDALSGDESHPDPQINNIEKRMGALEELKRERAQNEDFEAAARIKDAMISVQKFLNDMNESQNIMQKAAEDEDYLKASKLKAKREYSRVALLKWLDKAEHPADHNNFQNTHSDFDMHHKLDDLSLSTIRRVEDEDEPSVLTVFTTRPLPNVEECPIVLKDDSDDKSIFEQGLPIDRSEHDDYSSVRTDGPHPLDGVPGFEDLPMPEDVHKIIPSCEQANNLSNSFSSITTISSLEAILGVYCTKCFLSKNWALREAALLKLSLNIKNIVADLKTNDDAASRWWDVFSRGICVVLERAVDDKIVQVFLTSLIVLDDSVEEFETCQAPQKEVISLLSNVVLQLIDKLGEKNPKVVEGCETALMSLTLSSAVGPLYIGTRVMKLMSPSDSKAIQSVPRRCIFLKALLEEFGDEAPPCGKHIEFIQAYCIENKDSDARNAGKELAASLYLRDGNEVLSLLEDLPSRIVKEYQISFLKAKEEEIPLLINSPPKISRSTNKTTPGRKGRGRGRGRAKTFQS